MSRNVVRLLPLFFLFLVQAGNLQAKPKGILVDTDVLLAERIAAAVVPAASEFHLFSHAKPGALLINGEWLYGDALFLYLKQLLPRDTQRLYIYGCEFASGDVGLTAVAKLERRLGLQLLASTNITGASGDWQLEIGNYQASPALEAYPYSLQLPANLEPIYLFDTDTTNPATANANSGDSRIINGVRVTFNEGAVGAGSLSNSGTTNSGIRFLTFDGYTVIGTNDNGSIDNVQNGWANYLYHALHFSSPVMPGNGIFIADVDGSGANIEAVSIIGVDSSGNAVLPTLTAGNPAQMIIDTRPTPNDIPGVNTGTISTARRNASFNQSPTDSGSQVYANFGAAKVVSIYYLFGVFANGASSIGGIASGARALAEWVTCTGVAPNFPDTDADGKNDSCDLDDDNDGVLDKTEQMCEPPTGDWTVSGSMVNAMMGTTLVTVDYVDAGTSSVSYAPDGTFNNTNFWSNSAVAGSRSLEFLFNSGGSGGTFSILFAKPVINPVLHIDRIGGRVGAASTSSLWTLLTPSNGMSKLSGNTQLVVETNRFFREPISTGASEGQEATTGPSGTAAGSILILGEFLELEFKLENAGGTANVSDELELIIESCVALDTDNDGITNHLDLDSDGDMCSDTFESGVSNFINNPLATGSDTMVNKPADGGNVYSPEAHAGTNINTADYGNNGFYNPIENNDTQSAAYLGTYTYNAAINPGSGATPNANNACTTASQLRTTKSVADANGNGFAQNGETLNYTLTITNSGQSAAQISIRDLLNDVALNENPASPLTLNNVIRTNPSTPNPLTIQQLINGFTLDIPKRIDATTPRVATINFSVPVVNPITIGDTSVDNASTSSFRTTNICGTTATTDCLTSLPTPIDLVVTKTDGNTTYIPGSTAGETYTITVTNSGPNHVTGATITDNLPSGTSGGTWSCVSTSGTASCSPSSGTDNISGTVSLNAGSSVTYTLNLKTASSRTGNLMNTASATAPSGSFDSNTTNNSGMDTDTPVFNSDLSVTKTGTATYKFGENLTYTVTVTNAGPSDVPIGTKVQDTLPPGTVFVNSSPSICSQVSGQVYECAIPSPISGNTGTYSFTVTVTAPGS